MAETEQEKAARETAEAEAKKKAEEEANKGKSPVQGDTPNYKAMLEEATAKFEAEKVRREQAEYKIIELKRKKDPDPASDDGTNLDPEALKQEILDANKQELESFKSGLVQDVIEDELSKLTSNPDERALIKLQYEKGIVRTGFSRAQIQADLRNAHLLANGPRLEKTLAELKKGNQAKGTAAGASPASEDLAPTASTLSKQEEADALAIAQQRGVDVKIVRERMMKNKAASLPR